MRFVLNFLLLLIIIIPVFAVFQLLRRLDEHKADDGAKDRFFEALCEQYGRPYPGNTRPETPEPKRALTEDERIALAKRLSDDPFADITADDIRAESPESEEASADTAEDTSVSDMEVPEESPSESEAVQEDEKKTMNREEALRIVSNMLGSSKNKDDRGKGKAYYELQEMINRYKK